MKFKKLVSVLCSATCAVGGVGAKPSGGVKEKIAQMKKQSKEKGNKSLMTFGNFVRGYSFGGFSKENEEVLKARGVSDLLNGEVVSDVMEDLEVLGRDPEARKKVLELANSHKLRSWGRYFVSRLAVGGSGLALSVGFIQLFLIFLSRYDFVRDLKLEDLRDIAEKLHVSYVESDTEEEIINKLRRRLVIAAVVCFVVHFGLSAAFFASYCSSVKERGIKEFLEELVIEAEGMQNQANISGNKIQKKGSGSSVSSKNSKESNDGSGKSKKGRSGKKVKSKEADDSAKNEVLN